ncbi:MAG: hypothetical protein GC205_12690 [Bacteroidetes bacterium]|nr:hypothetical protein [Bacteroidota bacterium]
MKSVASSHPQSRPKQSLFTALWLIVGLLAVYSTVLDPGYLKREAFGQVVASSNGAITETLILPAGEGDGFGKQTRDASSSQTQLAVFSTNAQGSFAAHPKSGNPAEESEVKSGKECPGSRCYAARLGLPDAQSTSRYGHEQGKDAQALPLYDLYCSWRAFLAQA